MSEEKGSILQIPESVREDTANYRGQVEKYLKGDTSPISFRAYRVPMGVYEQRTTGKFMVRIRIGAGLALPYQLQKIAELSKKYGNGILHVTTRQDIQIHEVHIEDTPDVLEGLLEAGLSSRGGGGNTVRNVTACPRAGVCFHQNFNVSGYSIATAEYLLQDKSSFNLPRKYKIVFTGCKNDCAYASVADLGFFAHIKDGVKGFSMGGKILVEFLEQHPELLERVAGLALIDPTLPSRLKVENIRRLLDNNTLLIASEGENSPGEISAMLLEIPKVSFSGIHGEMPNKSLGEVIRFYGERKP